MEVAVFHSHRLPRALSVWPIVLLAAAALVAACGDDEPPPPAAGATPQTQEQPAPADSQAAPEAPAGADDPAAVAPAAPATNLLDGAVTDFDAAIDYFPEKATITHAANFTVAYHGNYKVLTALHPSPGAGPETYVLVQRGTPSPELQGDLANATVVEVPIASIFSESTTHLPFLEELGVLDTLTGVANAGFISSEAVLARIAAGQVTEYAPTFELNSELVIERDPDVLMTGGSEDPLYEGLRNAGIAVVANAEWLEPTPLGRAEWLKYMAVFYNREAMAESAFDAIVRGYEELRALTGDLADRPTVMTGFVFGGTWFATGGAGFMAQLIRDAGGDYIWSDDTGTEAIELDLEAQLDRGRDADLWLNVSAFWATLDDALAEDPRYAEFDAFTRGDVWNPTAVVNEAGANEFWELGVSRPDLILADLIRIIHPDLLPDHEPRWYLRLPQA